MRALWFCFVKHIYFFTVFFAIFVAHLLYSMSVFYVLTHFLEFSLSFLIFITFLTQTRLVIYATKILNEKVLNILDCKLVYGYSDF